jgi:(1->4)-alpha-D-glucan 1-alpha-D-glucosylmutase
VAQWSRINRPNRVPVDGMPAPDPNDEYLFYQVVLGAWPNEPPGAPLPEAAPEEFVDRIDAYMHKAIKEAKLHTSWITANMPYETAVSRFVRRSLTGPTAARFLGSFVPFVRRIAEVGAMNSLAQLTVKLAAPGVPDFYQGTELWDLSLVDPDNRRPIDWELRRTMLDAFERGLNGRDDASPAGWGAREPWNGLLESWYDGRVKLLVTALGLRWRRAHPLVCLQGNYLPLAASGRHADRVFAFAREAGGDRLVAVVPRLTASLSAAGGWPLGERVWEDTVLDLPPPLDGCEWQDVFTGTPYRVERAASRSGLPIGDLLAALPVALLWSDSRDSSA